jgi:hypothetical protein
MIQVRGTSSAKNPARRLTRCCGLVASLAVLFVASSAAADDLLVLQGNYLHKVDDSTGSYTALGGENWPNTTSMTFWEWDDRVYTISDEAMWRVSPYNGTYQKVTDEIWPGPTLITTAPTGSFTGGDFPQPIEAVYVIQDSYLWRVSMNWQTVEGTETALGTAAWPNATSIDSLDGYIYVIEGDVLWRVSPVDGSYVARGGAIWDGPTQMTHYGSYLYIAQDERIYKVDPSDGDILAYSGTGWDGTTSLASLNSFQTGAGLYAIQDDKLWKINPSTFSTTALTAAIWPGQTFMAGFY